MNLEINVEKLADAIVERMQGAATIPKFLSLQAVAEALDCSDKHVRSRIAAGELEAIDIGSAGTQHLRVTAESLAAYIRKRAVKVA